MVLGSLQTVNLRIPLFSRASAALSCDVLTVQPCSGQSQEPFWYHFEIEVVLASAGVGRAEGGACSLTDIMNHCQ